jgi:hypothetical protein
MYIRKSIRSYNDRTYTNYVLVESVHTAKGPRQKTVCSLGDLSPRPREEWLKLARKIEDALVGPVRATCSMRMMARSPTSLVGCGHGARTMSARTRSARLDRRGRTQAAVR